MPMTLTASGPLSVSSPAPSDPDEFNAWVDDLVDQGEAAVAGELRRILGQALATYGRNGDPAAFDIIGPEWAAFVSETLTPFLVEVFVRGAIAEWDARYGWEPVLAAVDPRDWADNVTDSARAWVARNEGWLANYTSALGRHFGDWVIVQRRRGLTPDQIASDLESAFGVGGVRRARVLIENTTMSAFNHGNISSARALGAQYKTWVAILDRRTRPDHTQAHSQTVPFNEPFYVGGWPMQQPHDMSAPPEQTANCRCVCNFHYPGDTLPDGTELGPPEPPGPATWTANDLGSERAPGVDQVTQDLNALYQGALDPDSGLTVSYLNVAPHPDDPKMLMWSVDIADDRGNHVASLVREIRWDGPEPYVYHSNFTVRPNYQGQGLATALNQAAEDFYRRVGINRIQLHANIDVGGYAWARQGYDWSYPTMMRGQIERWLIDAEDFLGYRIDAGTISETGAARTSFTISGLQRRLLAGDLPTPFELSQIGAKYPDEFGGTVGRDILLGQSWEGTKYLD